MIHLECTERASEFLQISLLQHALKSLISGHKHTHLFIYLEKFARLHFASLPPQPSGRKN